MSSERAVVSPVFEFVTAERRSCFWRRRCTKRNESLQGWLGFYVLIGFMGRAVHHWKCFVDGNDMYNDGGSTLLAGLVKSEKNSKFIPRQMSTPFFRFRP